MKYVFHAYGHPNIRGTHKTTFEFTKDKDISLNGDCIIGVNADFRLEKLRDFIKKTKNKQISITIETPDKKVKEDIKAELNPDFNHNREIVIRKTYFISERTFAIKANKAALDINRQIIDYLRKENNKIGVIFKNMSK